MWPTKAVKSLLGDIRNPTGRDPKQPAAVADLLRCLLPQPFCVSL